MQVLRFGRQLWLNRPCRWLTTITFAAFFGIAAGHTVMGSLGSICVVDGSSMAPTYQPGARVYTMPITTPLERGDIVLVNDGQGGFALKRIVGLPGETLHLWRGYVFINRHMLREPYLAKYTYTFPDEHSGHFAYKLGKGEYFVLGDNRPCSSDSRAYGPVLRDHIKSRVPAPGGALRAGFAAYTLPDEGKRTIRAL
jgi:signal peptidase I